MGVLFSILTTLLLISHSLFFFRAVYYRNRAFSPKNIDLFSKKLATILLIPALVTGSIAIKSPLITIIIWIPIVLIVISNFNKPLIIKYPYLLPLINLIFIIFITMLGIKELL